MNLKKIRKKNLNKTNKNDNTKNINTSLELNHNIILINFIVNKYNISELYIYL